MTAVILEKAQKGEGREGKKGLILAVLLLLRKDGSSSHAPPLDPIAPHQFGKKSLGWRWSIGLSAGAAALALKSTQALPIPHGLLCVWCTCRVQIDRGSSLHQAQAHPHPQPLPIRLCARRTRHAVRLSCRVESRTM